MSRISREIRLVQTDPAGLSLVQTPMGRFWMAKNDAGFPPHLLAEQERKIYGCGEYGIRPGDVVLGCGAHVGTYTRQALAEGAGTVIASEPAPHNLECLHRSLEPEIAARRVIVCAEGVWDREDVLTLHVLPHNPAADTFVVAPQGAHPQVKLPLTTIDSLVAGLKLPRVDFIKMDIEGTECRAIAGAKETLLKHKPRLAFACYHQPDDPERIPAALRSIWPGYRVVCGPWDTFRRPHRS